MAVYYFTGNGRESRLSDYLISGLTTEIANLSGNETTVVSRRGLDRVMSEQSLMVSDLVSGETQVNIGELLGADVILIGYIVPLDSFNKINIQIVEVETGLFWEGFFLNYRLEDGFSRDEVDRSVQADNGTAEITGITTVRTIYENFDGSFASLSPAHYEEYWGERVQYASAQTGKSGDGFGYLQFEAGFDSLDILNDWEDSDLNFYYMFSCDWDTANQDGVCFRAFPESFSRITVLVQQTDPDGEILVLAAQISLNPGEWTEMQIPFASFINLSEGGGFNFSKPYSIGFAIPFLDNYTDGWFRGGTSLKGRLRIDDLGLFRLNEPDADGLIEAFEDEVTRAPAILTTGGAFYYTDYSESEDGINRLNEAVESVSLRTDKETMAEAPLTAENTRVQLVFSLPGSAIQKALLKDGILNFFIDIDQMMLQ